MYLKITRICNLVVYSCCSLCSILMSVHLGGNAAPDSSIFILAQHKETLRQPQLYPWTNPQALDWTNCVVFWSYVEYEVQIYLTVRLLLFLVNQLDVTLPIFHHFVMLKVHKYSHGSFHSEEIMKVPLDSANKQWSYTVLILYIYIYMCVCVCVCMLILEYYYVCQQRHARVKCQSMLCVLIVISLLTR